MGCTQSQNKVKFTGNSRLSPGLSPGENKTCNSDSVDRVISEKTVNKVSKSAGSDESNSDNNERINTVVANGNTPVESANENFKWKQNKGENNSDANPEYIPEDIRVSQTSNSVSKKPTRTIPLKKISPSGDIKPISSPLNSSSKQFPKKTTSHNSQGNISKVQRATPVPIVHVNVKSAGDSKTVTSSTKTEAKNDELKITHNDKWTENFNVNVNSSSPRAQRTVQTRLTALDKVAQQKEQKRKDDRIKMDKVYQKDKEKELKQQQRAEIYALNKVMTDLEHSRFREFCIAKDIPLTES